jgi:HEPN domain-containing protein
MKENNIKQEAKRWLIQAEDEFFDADELRKRERYYIALFHFQQSAEKALKAFLYFKLNAREVLFTHSINELNKLAIELDEEFKMIRDAKKLDQYYIPTRYPNGLPGGVPSRFYDDPDQAEEAMNLAKKVIEIVNKKFEEN